MARLSRTILLIYLVLLLCAPVVFAEEVTITTYYPSPYGSYNELQLYPHSTPVATCNATNKGTMYYDSDDNTIHICNGTAWGLIGGGVVSGAADASFGQEFGNNYPTSTPNPCVTDARWPGVYFCNYTLTASASTYGYCAMQSMMIRDNYGFGHGTPSNTILGHDWSVVQTGSDWVLSMHFETTDVEDRMSGSMACWSN
jgi:hypothetical protein